MIQGPISTVIQMQPVIDSWIGCSRRTQQIKSTTTTTMMMTLLLMLVLVLNCWCGWWWKPNSRLAWGEGGRRDLKGNSSQWAGNGPRVPYNHLLETAASQYRWALWCPLRSPWLISYDPGVVDPPVDLNSGQRYYIHHISPNPSPHPSQLTIKTLNTSHTRCVHFLVKMRNENTI